MPGIPGNLVLGALSDVVKGRIAPHLTSLRFSVGDVLYDPDEPVETVYFPFTAVVSFGHALTDQRAASVALAGAEGLVGTELFLGGERAIGRSLVEMPGLLLCVNAQVLLREFEQERSAQSLCLRYVHALISQISINAVCERLHSIELRLVRWLLLMHDRRTEGELELTQERLAQLLGVRREGVAIAAKRLQEASLIGYRRGHIHIVDRPRLEAVSCSCYREIRAEYQRLTLFLVEQSDLQRL
jgi:CRP-like cAMP-binding protein